MAINLNFRKIAIFYLPMSNDTGQLLFTIIAVKFAKKKRMTTF